MTIPALERIYVILDALDKDRLDRLCQALSNLLPYANLTSNLHLVAQDLSGGMSQVERIQKVVQGYLRENLFARLYVHFVHGVFRKTVKDMEYDFQYYYQGWKRSTHVFDREGYMHQEVPRLMLLPVIVPRKGVQPSLLDGLLGVLKEAFLMPSLFLGREVVALAQEGGIRANVQKVYYGQDDPENLDSVVSSLCRQGLIEDASTLLDAETLSVSTPCTPDLIISAKDGSVYGCVDAFVKKESLGDIYGPFDARSLMTERYASDRSKRDCAACREGAAASFAACPVSEELTHDVGDLLFHFGTLHQEAEDYGRAEACFSTSLRLSPAEEAEPILFRLGLCHMKTGSPDEALAFFREAEATYKDQYYWHFFVGLCLYEQGDLPAALKAFSVATEMEPQHEDLVRLLIYTGTCFNGLGMYKDALAPLEQAKAAASRVKEIYSALGYSYFQLGDFDKAIENLGVAVALDPHSAIDHASLGANYREKGDVEKAVAMFEKALELNPSMASARENLERLRGDR